VPAPERHLAVGGNLVRKRGDGGGVDDEKRIEQIPQADAVGLGDKAQRVARAVEGPRALPGDEFEPRLLIP